MRVHLYSYISIYSVKTYLLKENHRTFCDYFTETLQPIINIFNPKYTFFQNRST